MQAEGTCQISTYRLAFPTWRATQLVMFGGIVNATKYAYIMAFSEFAIPH